MKRRFGDVELPFESRRNHGEKICVYCGQPLKGRRLRWCSQACVDQYLIRNNSSSLKQFILKRDHGICSVCGLDCVKLRNVFDYLRIRAGEKKRSSGPWSTVRGSIESNPDSLFKKKFQPIWLARLRAKYPWLYKFSRWDRDLYELDHIVPVVDGGGSCGPENIRTLCYPDHKKVTAKLMEKLAYERARLKKKSR